MTIYLYVKTHRKTGLKYLGKTERDPIKYKGSGTYWRLHIKKHGYDVETQILRECKDNNELKEWGLYYSRLWNVVESDEWANLVEENGDGVSSIDSKRIKNEPLLKEKISEQTKAMWQDIELRNKISESISKAWTDERKEKLRQIFKNMRDDDEFKEKIKNSWTEERKEKSSKKTKKLWENQEHRDLMKKKMSGKNSHFYDHTYYHFVHEDGLEEFCTKHDLYTKYNLNPSLITAIVKGKRKTHKGWKIVPKQED